jgi:hypothetical protein
VVEEIMVGNLVWFEPGEKRWNGGSAATAMRHIAIQKEVNGSLSSGGADALCHFRPWRSDGRESHLPAVNSRRYRSPFWWSAEEFWAARKPSSSLKRRSSLS